MRFLGNIEAKLDAKGRAFFPAVFRKVLQEHSEECLIMRKDLYQNCLVLYPESVWNQRLDALRSRLNRWNASHQMLFRQFVSDVEIITMDANGRILMPKRFQKAIHMQQSLRFIGMDDTIEIWTKEDTEQPFLDAAQFSAAMEQVMGNDAPEEGGSLL